MAITSEMQTQVTQLYVALFARAPESDGLGYWVNQLGGGASLDEVANAMFDSAPSRDTGYDTPSGHVNPLYPRWMTNEQIVDSFYQNVLGREADAEGRAYWTAKMNEPGVQQGSIILEMIGDVVSYDGDDAAGLYSQGLFVNRVEVAQAWAMRNGSLDGSVEILQAVTDDPATADAAIAGINAADTNGKTFSLSAGQDIVTGTGYNDVFKANVVQNANGAQVNSLGSGDEIDGGAGTDTLNAKITSGVFAGGSASMPIQPEIRNVENINLQAVIADISASGNNDVVYFNAKDVIGAQKIASNYSDASLVIQNLTSQGLNHVSDMTIGMEYTGNADHMWRESDLSVYFDQDYLTTQRLLSRPGVDIQVMNEDAYDETDGATPLAGVFFRELTFTLNGVRYDLTDYLTEDPSGAGTEIQTYADALAAIGDALAQLKAANPANAALQSMQVEMGPMFHADRNPDTLVLREGTSIRLTVDGITDGSDNELVVRQTDLELARAADAAVENNNRFERADNEPPMEDSTLSINVDLEKVGLAGDGGELIIGSMNKTADNHWGAVRTVTDTVSGIQEFNVTVHGTNDKSSSLAGLHSTNNNLRTVTIESEGGNAVGGWADLTIGNSNTTRLAYSWDAGGWVHPNDDDQFPPSWVSDERTVWSSIGSVPSLMNQYALKDVQTLDASAFKGDLSVWAALTGEVGAKYLDRTDASPHAAADDNVAFQYTGGEGNDYFNVAIDAANWEGSGPATREDWNLTIDGGAGNDEIVVGMVRSVIFDEDSVIDSLAFGGEDPLANREHWYANQKMMQNVEINGGDGNDVIRTMGSGDYIINAGNGNDTIYVDNTGDKAVWALNTAGGNLDNLLSDTNDSYLSWTGMKIQVTFHGFESVVDLAHVNGRTDDLAVNQAVKAAINADPVLSKLLLAQDGPGYSLVVKALIDGALADTNWMLEYLHDINVEMVWPTTLTAGDLAGLNAAWGTAYTEAQAVAALRGQAEAFNTESTYSNRNLETGSWSEHIQDSIITGGAGDDVIVLGTGEDSNDTIVYKGFGNGTDSIVHFDTSYYLEGGSETVYTPVPASPEMFRITFSNLVLSDQDDPTTLTFDGVTVTLDNTVVDSSLIPAADVAYQFVEDYNADAGRNYDATWNENTGIVDFVARVNGNVNPDVVVGDFVFTNVDNAPAALSNYVQGNDLYTFTAAVTESFEVDFAGTIATAGGNFTFDGETVNYAFGDGPVTLVNALLAKTYSNWTIEQLSPTEVKFTYKTAGTDVSDPNSIDVFTGMGDGIATVVAPHVNGAPSVTTGSQVESIVHHDAGMGSGMDYIDFSAYQAVQLRLDQADNPTWTDVNFGAVVAAAGQKYISMVESTTNAGEYTTKLWEVNASAPDTELGLIGVLDFGDTMEFNAMNFIGINSGAV